MWNDDSGNCPVNCMWKRYFNTKLSSWNRLPNWNGMQRARNVLPFSPRTAWYWTATGWIGRVVLACPQQQLHYTSETAQPVASVGDMHSCRLKLLLNTVIAVVSTVTSSINNLIPVKKSSYIAQYPVLRTVQSVLHFTSLTDGFTQDTISASLGSIQPYATINARKLLVHSKQITTARTALIVHWFSQTVTMDNDFCISWQTITKTIQLATYCYKCLVKNIWLVFCKSTNPFTKLKMFLCRSVKFIYIHIVRYRFKHHFCT